MLERWRTRERVLAAVLVACGAAAAAMLFLSVRAPRREPAPGVPPPKQEVVVVAAVAEVQRTLPGGGWGPVRAGDVLAVADSIRTGMGATAEIALGSGSRVTVAERTEVTVRELTAAIQRVGLLHGRIGVDVRPDGTRVMRVEHGSGSMIVSTTGGRIGVVASANALAVAAQEGRAVLESGGKAVEVAAGHQSAAFRGQPPVAPSPIPRALLLRVVRAIDARRASVCAVLDVDLAAEVLVDGVAVDVPADGRVAVRVPPRARRRGAEVVLRHANGSVERRQVPCSQDDADVSDLEVRWNAR